MEQLAPKQQQEVSKTSTERLRLLLVKAGADIEVIGSTDRPTLLNMYAEYLINPPVVAEGGVKPGGATGMSEEEMALRKAELDFKREKHEEDRKAKEEDRKAKELETERLIKKDEEDRKLKELEMERLIKKDEEDRKVKEEDRKLKEKELELKEIELDRQRYKDASELKRRESLAGQAKFFGDALKHSLPKMSMDPSDYPAYFKAVENLFEMYEVPKNLRSKLLIPLLNEKSKNLLAMLSREKLDDYVEVRDYLLREFKLTSEQYRDRFYSATKKSDETYTLFGTRAKTLFMYYLESRKAETKVDIINLLVSDRIKQTLPPECLKHVLSVEGTKWKTPEELTEVVDVYVNSNFNLPRNVMTNAKSLKFYTGSAENTSRQYKTAASSSGIPEKHAVLRCYRCSQIGHKAVDCKTVLPKTSHSAEKREIKPVKINHVQIETDSEIGNRYSQKFIGARVAEKVQEIKFPVKSHFSRIDEDWAIKNKNIVEADENFNMLQELPVGYPFEVSTCTAYLNSNTVVDNEKTASCKVMSENVDEGHYTSETIPLNANVNDEIIASEELSEWPTLSKLQYCKVMLEGQEEPVVALKDSGAEISLIHQDLIKDRDVPTLGIINIRGVVGTPVQAKVVTVGLKPNSVVTCENIGPYLPVMFAACDLGTDSKVILSSAVVEQLAEWSAYEVVRPQLSKFSVESENSVIQGVSKNCGDISEVHAKSHKDVNAVLTRSMSQQQSKSTDQDISGHDRSDMNFEQIMSFVNGQVIDSEGQLDTNASREIFIDEQKNDETLKKAWSFAQKNKANYFVKGGVLFHRDKVCGQKVEQVCLPTSRRDEVCRLAHDLDHLGVKKTNEKIRIHFHWDGMNKKVKDYVNSCLECQKNTREMKRERIPIMIVPRCEIPFAHLYMDIIGSLVDGAEFPYCLVLIDSCTRFPFAFPLKRVTSKAVCDCLIQIFSLVGVSTVITSDQGSYFVSELTTEFMKIFGCSPRWSSPLHPEGNSLCERLNQSLKHMLKHICKENPKQWHKMLPLALWCLRESKNTTLGVSPFMMVWGKNPTSPLKVIRDSWIGQNTLPMDTSKSVSEYLAELQQNIKNIHDYVDIHATKKQEEYVAQYNKTATPKSMQIGQQVIVLLPDSTNKFVSRWQGPGTVVNFKSPHTYLVELDRGQRRWLHVNKLRPYNARVNAALVNNCAIVNEADEDFGSLPVVEIKHESDLPSCRVSPEKLAHLSNAEKQQLLSTLDDFADVFVEKPGLCTIGEHEIHVTPDFKPKRLRAYRVPELLKPEVARQIQELLDLGFIQPSNSPMASPIVCVLKGRNGENGVRLCCDYRYLNKYTIGDAYPTPDISDVIHRVGKASHISSWDARSGYWQLSIKPEHRWLTAFVTDFGVFEWTRMAFGLKCASNTFIRVVQQILQPIREFNDSYVDDMATHSMNWEAHMGHMQSFLSRIREVGMTLKLEKCEFARPSVNFVGCIIGSGHYSPDPSKVACVESMQAPRTKKEVRQILGFYSYFRVFIEGFADIAKPLTDLTKKRVLHQIEWSEVHQKALDELKKRLCEATRLHIIKYGQPVGISVDASAISVGCCLFQWSEDGNEKPIAFASAKLTSTQMAWSAIEREAYAVIFALKKFRNFIFATKITVYSDHNPLMYLRECAPKSSKLTRWALALEAFDITWCYRPGNKNQVADCLSRLG